MLFLKKYHDTMSYTEENNDFKKFFRMWILFAINMNQNSGVMCTRIAFELTFKKHWLEWNNKSQN